MEDTIELRLVNLAQKVADMYSDMIPDEQYKRLSEAIEVCRAYHVKKQDNWGVMYEGVLGEDAIWEYAFYKDIQKEIANMWALVTDILICSCWLGCVAEHDPIGQDMDIRGENISEFVELLESCIVEKIDYATIFEYWGKEMCY